MSLKSKIDRLEQQIDLSSDDYSEELARAYAGWTDEELEVYATTGILPAGKVIKPLSEGAQKSLEAKYSDWTDEELETYATTGIKPDGKRL